jgi:hypothetical protein
LFRTPGIFISGDPHEGWWGTYLVATQVQMTLQNQWKLLSHEERVKAWVWDAPEVAGGPASSMAVHSKNVPNAAILKPEDYNLKFEINTLKPYNSNRIGINVALNAEDNNAYAWNPPYDSKKQWNTIVIPFEEVVKSCSKPVINPNDIGQEFCLVRVT